MNDEQFNLLMKKLDELDSIKKLLIMQLIQSGIPIESVAKIASMSTKTLYKFISKNQKKTVRGKHD